MSRCEAMVAINSVDMRERRTRYMYVACGEEPADLHHKLTRARGGLILDEAGETYHQMYLCRKHHNYAHSMPDGIGNGLLIRGSVTTDADGRPLYVGPDEYLSEHYGPREVAEQSGG